MNIDLLLDKERITGIGRWSMLYSVTITKSNLPTEKWQKHEHEIELSYDKNTIEWKDASIFNK